MGIQLLYRASQLLGDILGYVLADRIRGTNGRKCAVAELLVVGRPLEYLVALAAFDKQVDEKGADAPGVREFFESMNKLADVMMAFSQTEAAQKAINKPMQD